MATTWQPYSRDAERFARRYDDVNPEGIHRAWAHLLPDAGGRALDVGAGSGRDAAWLTRAGLQVVAAEPAAGMRRHAARTYGTRVRWLDDRLPALESVRRLGHRFDVVLLNAVWQHVAPRSRKRAVGALAELLATDGLLVVTLRHGPLDPARRMWPTDVAELDSLARGAALEPVPLVRAENRDFLGRDDISWTTHAFRASARVAAEPSSSS